MATSQAVQVYKDTVTLLENNQKTIEAALPDGFKIKRFIRSFTTTILKNPGLLKAEPRSLFNSLIECAQLGLTPNNTLGEVYLIPFWNHGKLEVQVIPGYRGYVALALRSNKVVDVEAFVVYEKEPFEVTYGSTPNIKHDPLPPETRGEKKIGAYATAIFANGHKKQRFMWTGDILKRRDRSQGAWEYDFTAKAPKRDKDGNKILKATSPWATDEDAMFTKTVIRDLGNDLPLSPEFQRAITLDIDAEAGKSQKEPDTEDLGAIIDITEEAHEGDMEAGGAKTDEKASSLKDRLKEAKGETVP